MWHQEFKAIVMAQGLLEVLGTTIDPTTLDPSAQDLDVMKNQAMYPVFQQTFLTSATKLIVLKQEAMKCLSRETWKRLVDYFKTTSIQHQNTKAKQDETSK